MRARLQKSQRGHALRTRRPARRATSPQAPGPQAPAPEPTLDTQRERAVAAGGSEDRELYSCSCGSHFQAPVSASVTCPRCGAEQAW